VLPKRLEGDAGGLKKAWLRGFRQRLEEQTALCEAGELPHKLWRDLAYLQPDLNILQAFYRRHRPALADPDKLHAVMRSFHEKAAAAGTHWADLMYETIARRYGVDPRHDDDGSASTSSGDDGDGWLLIDGEPVSDFATARFGARAADLTGLAAVVADPVLAEAPLCPRPPGAVKRP
jgi:hypothetical protein